jgi:hypothetical protein
MGGREKITYSTTYCTLHNTTSPVTIENPPDRDFRTGSEQAANKFPTTSVLFNVGIVEILSCNSLYVEYYRGSTEELSASESAHSLLP